MMNQLTNQRQQHKRTNDGNGRNGDDGEFYNNKENNRNANDKKSSKNNNTSTSSSSAAASSSSLSSSSSVIDPQPEELIVKKKARNSKPFTEDILVHPLGLQRIFEEFPQTFRFHNSNNFNSTAASNGCEAKDIKRLMNMYKDWAFQLHPGMVFQDVLSKIEQLGSKERIRGYLQMQRENERNRYVVSNACCCWR